MAAKIQINNDSINSFGVFFHHRPISFITFLKRGVQTGDVAVGANHEQQQHQREYHNGYQYFNDPLFPKHNP